MPRIPWVLLVVAGCSSSGGSSAPTRAETEFSGGKADGWSDLTLESEGLTLRVKPVIERRATPAGDRFVVHGTTSLELDGGEAVVRSRLAPDPARIGTWEQVTLERFELRLGADEMAKLLAGANLYLLPRLRDPDAKPYAVQLQTGVRISDTSGSGVNLLMDLWPYAIDGGVGYGLEGKTAEQWYGLGLAIESELFRASRIDTHWFYFDVPDETLLAVIGTSAPFEVGWGSTGSLVAVIRAGELYQTDRGAMAWYESPSCWNGVKTCLTALPAGARDTSACGSAIEVLECAGAVGVRADATDVEAASAAPA